MEEEQIQKSYYAVLPANVRYDKDLTPNAKLLYAEITSLCNEKGYCWATNKYFAELYGVSKVSVSNWISELERKGYLENEIIYADETKQILGRHIKIFNIGIKEIFNRGIKENFTNNIKEDNIKKENNIIAESVIAYLNEKAGTHFRPIESNLKFINARLKDYCEDDLKRVIDKKVDDWKGSEMQMYLRPETLFNATKFETYLNGLEDRKGLKNYERKINRSEANSMFQNIDEIEI